LTGCGPSRGRTTVQRGGRPGSPTVASTGTCGSLRGTASLVCRSVLSIQSGEVLCSPPLLLLGNGHTCGGACREDRRVPSAAPAQFVEQDVEHDGDQGGRADTGGEDHPDPLGES